ncbi:MAG: hypothetical protein ACD_33C00017G0004 [uncultured bacterium]|nr:MAG: hypothetical protein ACD_33C00017G0004 [uncultured bacterium]
MAKLFSLEEKQNEVRNTDDLDIDISEVIEDDLGNLDLAIEKFNTAVNGLNTLNSIKTNIEDKNIGSVPYFITIENYKPILESIANNLGVKSKIPSLEDFNNPYGLKASHEIAMEGFYDYIKKLWEKIKDFFKAFWKKLMLFFKRLLKLDLDLEEYEKYVEKMIFDIKHKDLKVLDNTPLISKLPVLLADSNVADFNANDLISVGATKINNLINLKHNLLNFNKEIVKDVNKLSDLIKQVYNPELLRKVLDFSKDLDNEIDKAKNDKIMILKILSTYHGLFEGGNQKITLSHEMLGASNFIHTVSENKYTDKVLNFISNLNSDNKVSVTSIIDDHDTFSKLPKNTNIYRISVSEENENHASLIKIIFMSDDDVNVSLENKLEPLMNSNNVILFYDLYKKLNSYNIKDLINSFINMEKESNELLDLCKYSISNRLEVTDEIISKFEKINNILKNDDVGLIISGIKSYKTQLLDENKQYTILSNNIITMVKELSATIVSLDAEIKYELIKYIYNTCNRFK